MPNALAIIAGAIIVGALIVIPLAAGQSKSASEPLPRIDDFRVATTLPARKDRAVVARWEGPNDDMDSRVRLEAKKRPNFAGHFTIVVASCGLQCSNAWIVDVNTGRIYNPPFIGVGLCSLSLIDEPDLSFKLDSNLLIVTGSLELPDPKSHTFTDGPCGKFFYRWDGRRVNLIRSVVPY